MCFQGEVTLNHVDKPVLSEEWVFIVCENTASVPFIKTLCRTKDSTCTVVHPTHHEVSILVQDKKLFTEINASLAVTATSLIHDRTNAVSMKLLLMLC